MCLPQRIHFLSESIALLSDNVTLKIILYLNTSSCVFFLLSSSYYSPLLFTPWILLFPHPVEPEFLKQYEVGAVLLAQFKLAERRNQSFIHSFSAL